jgi:glycosyltransferase involved in cell wall biosynthesis
MKILFLNSSDNAGGAARSAYRLMKELQKNDLDVNMLVRSKSTDDKNVFSCFDLLEKRNFRRVRHFFWRINNKIRIGKWKKYPNKKNVFLNDLDSIPLLNVINKFDFDVLHLHFVANRFLNLEELKKINKPIVWTLHDCWPFTGICHFFYDCKNYENKCGLCPMLQSYVEKDLSHIIWKKKSLAYENLTMHIVSPSKWLGVCAQKSSLFQRFPISVIHNPLNNNAFKPLVKAEARESLDLKNDVAYILFGAASPTSDTNKGFDLLVSALENLKIKNSRNIEILVLGTDKPSKDYFPGFTANYLGVVSEDSVLINLYSSVDVVVVPSRSENLSNMIVESFSCACPVVAFDVGGNGELIEHQKTGYLATPFDSVDLSNGILWCIENNLNGQLSIAARQKIENEFITDDITDAYIDIYKKLCK